VSLLDQELAKIRSEVGEQTWAAGHPELTRSVFERVCLQSELPEFLTSVAYPLLNELTS
jgi:hypothetical protein